MTNFIKALIVISLFICCVSDSTITIFLIGDSTMSDKPNPKENPERGWGQMLPLFFNENVTIKNYAVNGRSSKSFINEGKWDTVLSQVNEGDYVFIQFGHNDKKIKDKQRFTNPLTGYRKNLVRFINDTRSKGGIPVLFSSIVRRKFNEFGVLMDTHGIYPLVVRQVSMELNVPFINLQSKSENLVLTSGQEKSKELYVWTKPGEYKMYPDGREDNTHLSVKGATQVAKAVVEVIKENNWDIAKFLKISD